MDADETLVEYRARAQFIISRRMTWGSTDEIREHLDAVVDQLVACSEMEEVEIDAALDRPTIELDLVFAVPKTADADHHARTLIGEAIRANAGLHEGLLPLGEESQAKSTQNAWAGLRTPWWYIRSFDVEELQE